MPRALTSASWGVGFERADAGVPPTAFGAATPQLFVAAAVVGGATAAVAWDGLLARTAALGDSRARGGGPRVLVRRLLAVALGAPCALALGLGAVAPGSSLVAGAVVATACLLRTRGGPGVRGTARATHGDTTPRPRRPLARDRRRAIAVGGLATAGLVLGVASTAQALWGVLGPGVLAELGVPLADLPAMNLGLAAGSVVAPLVVVAVALVVAPTRGRTARLVVGGVVVALLLRAVSASRGPDGDDGTYLLLAGGLLLGLATTAPLARVVPGPAALRRSTTALLGAALGLGVGTGVLAVAPLLTPLAAAGVLVALAVSAIGVLQTSEEARRTPIGSAAQP